ncbi:MAG: DUF2256 domain-containing protein [Alphaproteobacteria bacterium 32-64-14]|nr:MAG: DUF2256 domain-containing protein [Alphaproteobacteria bacterium 32-64-14]
MRGQSAKARAGKAVPKADLPSKPCMACGRPFSWRKKWERCWEEVRFCSDRCRRDRKPGGPGSVE